MSTFQYFYFKPLNPEQVQDIPKLAHLPRPDRRSAFFYWGQSHKQKALLFYQTQYERHQMLLERDFLKHIGMNDFQEVYDAEMMDLWYEYRDEYGLNDHQQAYKQESRNYLAWGREHSLMQINEDDTFLHMMENPNHPLQWESVIDEAWFNIATKKHNSDIQQLRSMDYKLYLETPHWKRLRAAMILVNRSRCQLCISPEAAWGYEHRIHVHHLTYKNRGAEQFEDLMLLCDDCHTKVHEDKDYARRGELNWKLSL